MNEDEPTPDQTTESGSEVPTLPSIWNWKRFIPVGVLMVLGVSFFVTLFFLVRGYEKKQRKELFSRVAMGHIQTFIRRAQSGLESLMSIGHFFSASQVVDASEFKAFVRAPLGWHPEIESFQWVPKVTATERTSFESLRRMAILERGRDGNMVPAAEGRAAYYPLLYYETLDSATPRFGVDYGAHAESRAAMERAIAEGKGNVVATGPMTGGLDGATPTGTARVRVFLPMYRSAEGVISGLPTSATLRQEELIGFAVMVLVPREMIHQVLDSNRDHLEVGLYDEVQTLVGPEGGEPVGKEALEGVVGKETLFLERAKLDMAGRYWTVLCRPSEQFVVKAAWESWAVLLGGLILTGLLSSYLYTLLGQAAYIENVVTRRTRELASMNVRLQNEIGERERGERALRNSEALYHSLVDSLPMNILRKNMKGEITFGNRRYCETMRKPLELLQGKTDFDLFPKHLAEKYVADDHRVIETKQVFEDVEAHRRTDGAMVYMHILKAPVTDAVGKVVGTQVIFWDVTEKKQAEEALKQTLDDLERSNRDLEQFAYVASHDLQEPLRMVASYTELLSKRYEDKLDHEAQEFVHFIVDGAVRMKALIDDLLTYSRLGMRSEPFAQTSCESALKEALTNLQVSIDENGTLITHAALPEVHGDHTQLVQLFQNLVSNAIKFRGDASPKVEITAQARDSEWEFAVRDNGLGIGPKFLEKIFVIFQRLHVREKYPGTGIGLAICKKIIERHGGRIWVDSQPGHGTTVRFTLPVCQE